MRLLRTALIVAAALATPACTSLAPTAMVIPLAGPAASAQPSLNPASAASLISAFRAENGLGAVAASNDLNRAAQVQADAMARTGELSHTVAGTLPERLEQLRVLGAAENIAAGQRNLAEALAGWKQSPGHRANLLMATATQIGIAVAFNASDPYRTYWALILAGPNY